MKNEIYQILTKVQNGEQSVGEAQAELLFIFSVMQAEGSDGAEGAAVGNSAAGQSGSVGVMKWCDSCGKITKWIDGDCENYKTRGGSAKGALPR